MITQKHQSTEIRQHQIILAARKLIIKRGSEHIRIKEIADEVGITEGAIYRHFRSKKDILSLLVEEIETDLIGDIEGAEGNDTSALVILEEVLRNHLSAIEQRRGISFLVIAEIISLGDKKLNRKISAAIEKYLDRFKMLLARGIESGELRPDLDLDATATLFFGMVQGLVSIWALNGYNFSLEEQYEPLWQTFRHSIIQH
jgi:AcrR family transcriptional regulator